MSDLKIFKSNMNSNKYIFKKNSGLKRKSRKRLFNESALMFFLGIFLIYVNYLIPNKSSLLTKLPTTLNKSYFLIVDLFSNIFQISLVIFTFISPLIIVILLLGSLYRIFKVIKRTTK